MAENEQVVAMNEIETKTTEQPQPVKRGPGRPKKVEADIEAPAGPKTEKPEYVEFEARPRKPAPPIDVDVTPEGQDEMRELVERHMPDAVMKYKRDHAGRITHKIDPPKHAFFADTPMVHRYEERGYHLAKDEEGNNIPWKGHTLMWIETPIWRKQVESDAWRSQKALQEAKDGAGYGERLEDVGQAPDD